MVTAGELLTVDEFAAIPQPRGGVRQELNHGKVVESLPVKLFHTKIQYNLRVLLTPLLNPSLHEITNEFPFRPLPEHEVWVADVAIFDVAACEGTADDDYYRGVPPAVIEVLSPSNTASEMMDRENMCLQNGGREFWLVDPPRQRVKVIQAGG